MNPTTGLCEDGDTSSNKGKSCTSDSDCAGAKCECGWNNQGAKFCGLLPGDDEWKTARAKFKTYFEATKDTCSSAERWGECSEPGKYYSWKCEELKAQNYAILIEDTSANLTCMNTLRQDLPTFKTIDEICAKALAKWLKLGLLAIVALLY